MALVLFQIGEDISTKAGPHKLSAVAAAQLVIKTFKVKYYRKSHKRIQH